LIPFSLDALEREGKEKRGGGFPIVLLLIQRLLNKQRSAAGVHMYFFIAALLSQNSFGQHCVLHLHCGVERAILVFFSSFSFARMRGRMAEIISEKK
jgi:hypothetical protein